MPPRYAYWTILVDGQPTAFRAAEVDELLPTLKRLQVKQPTAVMKWFQRGRLWDSHDEAREKLAEGYTVNPDGSLAPPSEEHRAKGWRPGGEHRDPREKYQLAKKAKWQKFKQMVRSRPGHGPKADDSAPPAEDQPPGGDQLPPPEPPATDWRGRPVDPDAPAPAPRPRAPRPEWRDKPSGPRGPKPEWGDKPAGPRGPKPEWRDRGPSSSRSGPKKPWGGKPAGGGRFAPRGGARGPGGPRKKKE
jgi:hypothetical protein